MYLELLWATLAAVAISLALTRTMLVVAPRLGLMDSPGERRIHLHPIPRAGGLAIWLTFILVVGTLVISGWGSAIIPLRDNWLLAFVGGSSLLMVTGLVDDRMGLPPLVKLSAHILAPTAFYLIHPVTTGIFPASWSPRYDFGLFVIWSVALINAFNLIDGLDGLCGGLAMVACSALAALALANGRPDAALLLLVMAGAVLGFLRYNYNPARIFLGDAGSMLIGFFLATAATDAVGRKAVAGIILLPIAVAGVPLLDVLLAIWRRGAKRIVRQLRGEISGGGFFSPDREHLHHRLLQSGGSQRKVAIILQAIAILFAGLAFLPMIFGDRVIGFSVVGLLIVGLVGIRNLAQVEMEQTGDVIHMAIKLPGHRRRVAATLFVYDILVLSLAGLAAILIETNLLFRGFNFHHLVNFSVMFTVLGSISLLVVQVHRRLWVRATMRDILSLQFWLLLAAIATFTIFCLSNSDLDWSALRVTIMAYVFACIGVCLPRVALDLLREFGLDARHISAKRIGVEERWPVVVLGAGDLGTLLVDHLKSSPMDFYPGMQMLGFIDETKVLHGRRLRSFKVLGDLSAVPKLAQESGLKGIIVAIERPREELLAQLDALADEFELQIYRWSVSLHTT
jgi:UDP-GlcNAc:undecaprenyl-phosphate GlcNAc-1-phosphate transferase